MQPSFLWLRAPAQSAAAGLGDTNVDAKWRFWGADPWSLAVRAGWEVPTSTHGLGLPHGDLGEHVLLVATWDSAPTTLHANLGLTRYPLGAGTRVAVGHVSAALMQALDERFIVTVDGGFDQDPDPARRVWPGYVLAGVIYTVHPGLDLDVGYQVSVRALPSSRQALAGITYRFAL